MTSHLHQQIRRTIRRHDLCPPGSRVLIGVSGGSDSVALTRLLLDLAELNGFAVAGLAHLNHQLRPTAGRDEQFCRDFAVAVGLTIVIDAIDVKDHAGVHGLSVEEAARHLRYGMLERAADNLGASVIAVGHTQDDQAETFLLKLMRGAGLRGLAGIYPRRGRVIRPLLDVSRQELRDYLRRVRQPWVDDETNDALENPRNRVRHVVLPELDRAAGGATRPAIARAAGVIREDAEWLDAQARERFGALVSSTATGLVADASALRAEPPPLRRRVLLEALRQAGDGREIGLDHIEAVEAILDGNAGGADVPGGRVELRRGKLVLVRQKGSAR